MEEEQGEKYSKTANNIKGNDNGTSYSTKI